MRPHRPPGPAPTSPRRAWLRRGAQCCLLGGAGAVAAALSGCGFGLRQTPPMAFNRLHLAGFNERSPMLAELRERLRAAQVQLLPAPAQAELVLHALDDRREKRVVASTAVGQVRELQLRVRFSFRAATPGGRELIAATELMLSRDMSYSETVALAKAQEEAELYASMQGDIVQQVLRRLSSAQVRG